MIPDQLLRTRQQQRHRSQYLCLMRREDRNHGTSIGSVKMRLVLFVARAAPPIPPASNYNNHRSGATDPRTLLFALLAPPGLVSAVEARKLRQILPLGQSCPFRQG